MIYYDFKKGLTPLQCYKSLSETFVSSCPSRATVYFWFNEFRRGRQTVKDDPRSGRPNEVVTDTNVQRVRKLIERDPHCTYGIIQATLHVSSTTVHTILHRHLGLRRRCCRWIPHSLSQDQKEARVEWCRLMLDKYAEGTSKSVFNIVTGDETWVYTFDPKSKQQSTVWCFAGQAQPTKVRQQRSVGKVMVATFFCKTGHLATVPLREQRTVNSAWFTNICFPEVIHAWGITHPKTGTKSILLHHDNASSYTSSATRAYLDQNKIHTVPHPPYSPDLAPCDFFLFPFVKKQLKGTRFSSVDTALEAYLDAVNDIPKSKWASCFSSWFRRMKLCIDASGEYFEKCK